MDYGYFPDTDNIEDRRGDEVSPENLMKSDNAFSNLDREHYVAPPTRSILDITGDEWKDSLSDTANRAVGTGPWLRATRGSLEQQMGRNAIPYAEGGPVIGGPISKHLKLLTRHPTRPDVKVVRNKPIPFLAGSSNDAKTVYLDPAIPRVINVNKKLIDPAGPLSVHEIDERIAIHILLEAAQKGEWKPTKTGDAVREEIYELAHNKVGDPAERQYLVDTYGFTSADWDRYQQIMHELAARTEKQSLDQAPKDLYTYMYPHSAGHPHGGGKADVGDSGPPSDDGDLRVNRHERHEYDERQNEEKYKGDKGFAPASPDAYDDFTDEEHVG